MSSHHFVKEFQEPALLILSLEEQQIEKLESLLEWAPYVIVHENVFADILNKEIKIDAVLCQKENRELILNSLEMQWNIALFEIELSDNLIQKSLNIIEKKGGRNLNVFDSLNTLHIDFQYFGSTHSQILIFSDYYKWYLPNELKFEKWLPKNSRLQFKGIVNNELVIKGTYQQITETEILTSADGLLSITSKENKKWLIGEPF